MLLVEVVTNSIGIHNAVSALAAAQVGTSDSGAKSTAVGSDGIIVVPEAAVAPAGNTALANSAADGVPCSVSEIPVALGWRPLSAPPVYNLLPLGNTFLMYQLAESIGNIFANYVPGSVAHAGAIPASTMAVFSPGQYANGFARVNRSHLLALSALLLACFPVPQKK